MASHTTYVCDQCGSTSRDAGYVRQFAHPLGPVDLCSGCQHKIVTRSLAGEASVVSRFCDRCKGSGKVVVASYTDPAGGPADREYGPCPKCR